MKRSFQFDYLLGTGLQPEDYLLDLGCGTLRGGIPLIEYLAEGRYYGLENRRDVLRDGRRELEEAGLEAKRPVLVAAKDLSAIELGVSFQFIWAFSVLIHMSDEVLDGCLDFVSRQLTPAGLMYTNVNIGDHDDGKWKGFPIVWRDREFYLEAADSHGLDCEVLGVLRDLGHHAGNSSDNQTMLRLRKRS